VTLKSDALVLRKYDFRESSQIAHLFTRQFGKVRLIAKGVKKKSRSFDGALDLLEIGSACWIERGSGGLGILTEWRQQRAFPAMRSRLDAWYTGLYLAELLDSLTEDHDPHPLLFDRLPSALDALADPAIAPAASIGFRLLLLREVGIYPMFERCVLCGWDSDDELHFSPSAGGTVCRDCEMHVFDKRPLSPAVWRILCGAGEGVAPSSLTDAAATELDRHLDDHFRYVLGREPTTAKFRRK